MEDISLTVILKQFENYGKIDEMGLSFCQFVSCVCQENLAAFTYELLELKKTIKKTKSFDDKIKHLKTACKNSLLPEEQKEIKYTFY